MQWESWSEFWAMGGAAPYVWGSYAVTALLIALELVLVFRSRRAAVSRLLRLRRVSAGGNGARRADMPSPVAPEAGSTQRP